MNTKPKLRDEVIADMRDAFSLLIEQIAHDGKFVSCINCIWWVSTSELCTKARQRPPAKVIALGCEMWEDTLTIPF